MTNSQRIIALRKLLKIAKEGTFNLFQVKSYCNGKPVSESINVLGTLLHSTEQWQLDKVLFDFATLGEYPATISEIEKEKKIIRLILDAGANPNASYRSASDSVFMHFFYYPNKLYGLKELVQDDRFECPESLQECYAQLEKKPLLRYCVSKSEREQLENRYEQDKEDIIYTLFQKDMYPKDRKIFEKLCPIVLKKDPDFFEKKKEKRQQDLKNETQKLVRAKTPVQIYSALMGKRKEKN